MTRVGTREHWHRRLARPELYAAGIWESHRLDSQDDKALRELGEILERFGKALIATGRKLTKTYQGGQMSLQQQQRQRKKERIDVFGYAICANCDRTPVPGSEFCDQCSTG